jgi:hypothetical protein
LSSLTAKLPSPSPLDRHPRRTLVDVAVKIGPQGRRAFRARPAGFASEPSAVSPRTPPPSRRLALPNLSNPACSRSLVAPCRNHDKAEEHRRRRDRRPLLAENRRRRQGRSRSEPLQRRGSTPYVPQPRRRSCFQTSPPATALESGIAGAAIALLRSLSVPLPSALFPPFGLSRRQKWNRNIPSAPQRANRTNVAVSGWPRHESQ